MDAETTRPEITAKTFKPGMRIRYTVFGLTREEDVSHVMTVVKIERYRSLRHKNVTCTVDYLPGQEFLNNSRILASNLNFHKGVILE